ncbi:MAG: hypothetical protein WCT23_10395 [Candidatus Neomarinimicrobiota bacterium]
MSKTIYSDSGHAWLQVPRVELAQLGILEQISGYSYELDGMVYLEEDCDMPIYIEALPEAERTGIIYDWEDVDSSPIRNYPRFSGGKR